MYEFMRLHLNTTATLSFLSALLFEATVAVTERTAEYGRSIVTVSPFFRVFAVSASRVQSRYQSKFVETLPMTLSETSSGSDFRSFSMSSGVSFDTLSYLVASS